VPAPAYPLTYLPSAAERGEALFATHCAECHESGRDNRLGTVIPLAEIGTDPARTKAWTREAADAANEKVVHGLGMERTPMSKPYDGYVALQLDGLWLRGPYLHNGSVPTVRALLEPPECRPKIFFRGYDLLDREHMGFAALQCDDNGRPVMGYELPVGCETRVLSGCVPSYNAQRYFRFDTAEVGNGNQGHVYGTDLSNDDKRALVEYLKQRDRGAPAAAETSPAPHQGDAP
jgi:cytochrome c553